MTQLLHVWKSAAKSWKLVKTCSNTIDQISVSCRNIKFKIPVPRKHDTYDHPRSEQLWTVAWYEAVAFTKFIDMFFLIHILCQYKMSLIKLQIYFDLTLQQSGVFSGGQKNANMVIQLINHNWRKSTVTQHVNLVRGKTIKGLINIRQLLVSQSLLLEYNSQRVSFCFFSSCNS